MHPRKRCDTMSQAHLVQPSTVSAIHEEEHNLRPSKVVAPQRANAITAADIPQRELRALVFHGLDVEPDGGNLCTRQAKHMQLAHHFVRQHHNAQRCGNRTAPYRDNFLPQFHLVQHRGSARSIRAQLTPKHVTIGSPTTPKSTPLRYGSTRDTRTISPRISGLPNIRRSNEAMADIVPNKHCNRATFRRSHDDRPDAGGRFMLLHHVSSLTSPRMRAQIVLLRHVVPYFVTDPRRSTFAKGVSHRRHKM